LYVWFDAPIGYILLQRTYNTDWEKYWKDKDTKMVHFIGKDNIVSIALSSPLCLELRQLHSPENVPANEFLNLEMINYHFTELGSMAPRVLEDFSPK